MKTIQKCLVLLLMTLVALPMKAQDAPTTAQWQEDLQFLKTTIHSDYPFLFKKITVSQWDAAVAAFYDEIPTLETHEIQVGMSRMVSLFEYGHTQIRFSTLTKDGVLPVNLYHFADGVYVEGATKEHRKIVKAKVLKIGNVPVDAALKAIRPVVPVENDSYFKAYGLRFLTVPAILHAQGVLPEMTNTVALTLEKDGTTFEQVLATIPYEAMSRDYNLTIPNEQWVSGRAQDVTPLYLKHLNDKLYYYEYFPNTKTLYVRQSSVFNDENETLKAFYERLFAFIDSTEIDKLVYDVRLNGGGNNYNNKPLIQGIMARPTINQKGKFFYIIGRNTFSACQNLTNEITNYTEAILVGEPTAENLNFYGDARKLTLPNSKIDVNLSYAWWQDKPQWENADWTIPNVAVTMTSQEYFTNQDPVLEAALGFTDNGMVLNPLAYLTDIFTTGDFEKLRSEGKRIAMDPAYKYYNFEEEFGKAGFRLFQIGQTDAGILILQMVADIYPESQSALYSLASSQEQVGQTEKARMNYQKIVALDSESTLANTAKKRLGKLIKKE